MGENGTAGVGQHHLARTEGRTIRNPMNIAARRADVLVESTDYSRGGGVGGSQERPNFLLDVTTVEGTALSHRGVVFRSSSDANSDPALDTTNRGARVKRTAYEAVFDVSEATNPSSRLVIFAVSTTGMIGAEGMKFLQEECGIDVDGGATPDTESVTTMRRLVQAISCETQRMRGQAAYTAINIGLTESPNLHLSNDAHVPITNISQAARDHPSNTYRDPLAKGLLPAGTFDYHSHFGFRPLPTLRHPAGFSQFTPPAPALPITALATGRRGGSPRPGSSTPTPTATLASGRATPSQNSRTRPSQGPPTLTETQTTVPSDLSQLTQNTGVSSNGRPRTQHNYNQMSNGPD